jgi:XTP/dITP diphosphohydrolase
MTSAAGHPDRLQPRLRLVLASNNAGKLSELRVLFDGMPLDLVAQPSLQLAEADEPHASFVENALAKARHAARGSGAAALADDSGLCVLALDGAPGVVSAHFAGIELPDGEREARRRVQDAANNRLLLERLQGVDDRRASFVCTLVALRHEHDPQPLISTGRWHGEILHVPRGEGGFGYDPLLFIPAAGCTVAQMPAERKNQLSHRGQACAQMRTLLQTHWFEA